MDTGDIIRWKQYLAVVGKKEKETDHLVSVLVVSNTEMIEWELDLGKPLRKPSWVQITLAVNDPDVEVLL